MTNLDKIMQMNSHLIHSFADLHDVKQDGGPTVITSAEGAYVQNSEGEKLIDGIGGLWCVNIGHGRHEIIEAITKQLQELDYYSTFYNLTHPLAAELAEKVTSLAPANLNHVYFANSGSVANDTAIRILHHYYNRIGKPEKKKILSRIGAYHGSTHLAIAMTTPAYRVGWDSAEELVHHLSSPLSYRRPDGMTEDEFCDHLIDEMKTSIEQIGAENICCFIAEPIMGAGGVIVPPEGYQKRAEEVMRAYDIKTVSDEVVTAFCRLGSFFASEEVFGITPDIITTAKGLTSGYQPMSATLISDEIYDVISESGNYFLHGMTYSGHPACAAAALTNIALMENEDLPQHVHHVGKIFENTMKSLGDLDIVGDVRGSHFMIGIEFVADKSTKTVFDDEVMIGKRVAKAAQARGLVVRPLGHMAVLSPPLILNEQLVSDIGTILRDSIIDVQNSL